MTVEKITLPSSLVKDLREEDDRDGYAYRRVIAGTTGRWRQRMTLVIRRLSDSKLFGVDYEQGLTENCDNSYPWECDDEVTFREMEEVPVEIIKIRYKWA